MIKKQGLRYIIFLLFAILLFDGCVPTYKYRYRDDGKIIRQRSMPNRMVKIGLSIKQTNKLELKPLNCDFKVYDNGKEKLTLQKDTAYSLGLYKGNIVIKGLKVLGKEIFLSSQNAKGMLKINEKTYRGSIFVKEKRNMFEVINELDIEDYLYGIIGREISPSWPKDALKAQAVAARTYTLRNLNRHEKEGYNLCDTQHCQVYGGVDAEDVRTNDAVNETKGLVISYENELAQVFYHSACGGNTENVKNVWPYNGVVPEYLRGRRCNYCKGNPKEEWKTHISFKTITEKMKKAGYDADQISGVKVKEWTKTGRIKKIQVISENSKIILKGTEFRAIIGYDVLYSTLVEPENKREELIFRGRGWGHGIGMCQYGIKGMADKGHSWKEILNFYFPGTKVKEWDKL
ncbi:MAG: SpoIID/LytB domain-containing protein [Elusimicrobiota bacterium]